MQPVNLQGLTSTSLAQELYSAGGQTSSRNLDDKQTSPPPGREMSAQIDCSPSGPIARKAFQRGGAPRSEKGKRKAGEVMLKMSNTLLLLLLLLRSSAARKTSDRRRRRGGFPLSFISAQRKQKRGERSRFSP